MTRDTFSRLQLHVASSYKQEVILLFHHLCFLLNLIRQKVQIFFFVAKKLSHSIFSDW